MSEASAERRREMEDGATIIVELDAGLAMINAGLTSLGARPRNLDATMQQPAPGYERFLKLNFTLGSRWDLLTPATFEVRMRLQRLARAIGRMWIFGALERAELGAASGQRPQHWGFDSDRTPRS